MNLFEFALKVNVLNDEENVSFEFITKKFTSRTFTHLVTKSGIPLSIGMKAFVDTAVDNAFVDNLEVLFQSVNENGGWNILGWMRSGRQKDQNSNSGGRGDSTTVESGVIKFNLTKIRANKEIANTLKLDVERIVETQMSATSSI